MNNVLTASRQASIMSCLRAHYWAYEVGLRKTEDSKALRIGSAWHRAMDVRWRGGSYESALEAAFDTGSETLPTLEAAIIAGLLGGYFDKWGGQECGVEMQAEKEFDLSLPGSITFSVAGKIDCIGISNGIEKLIESKTTGSSIAPDSDYWLRLRFNTQIFQYVLAARALGWNPAEVVYDVTRKPSIKPKMIDDLDKDGLKIVTELATGKRAKLKNGKWRQSGGEGFLVNWHTESADEFGERLRLDTLARPDFYFQRREIPILSDLLDEFQSQRLALAKLILHLRLAEKQHKKPESAWPRNVSDRSCKFCNYQSFCLQNISPNLKSPPAGFSIGKFNPELSIIEEENETIE